jgi:hypothetical protein
MPPAEELAPPSPVASICAFSVFLKISTKPGLSLGVMTYNFVTYWKCLIENSI